MGYVQKNCLVFQILSIERYLLLELMDQNRVLQGFVNNTLVFITLIIYLNVKSFDWSNVF